MTTPTIPTHYDPDALIEASSDPAAEYLVWKLQAQREPDEWTGSEFTLQDFEEHIASLAPAKNSAPKTVQVTDTNFRAAGTARVIVDLVAGQPVTVYHRGKAYYFTRNGIGRNWCRDEATREFSGVEDAGRVWLNAALTQLLED